MVHCVSSSEPDSGDGAMMSDDWRIQGSMTKEIRLNQPGHHRKAYVESTVTTGIQVGTHVEQGTHQLTLIDMHQQADTTHPENTYVDSQEHMDTSSPNHSTYSDTMDHLRVEEQLNTNKEIENTLLNIGDSSMPIGHTHYQPIVYSNHQYVPDVYRQQTLLSDHEYFTAPTQSENFIGLLSEDELTTDQIDPQVELHSDGNTQQKILDAQNYNVPYLSEHGVNQKVLSVGITTPELYPHLYNYQSDSNEIAVVDYQSDNFNSYIYNNITYVDQHDDYEESDSSLED